MPGSHKAISRFRIKAAALLALRAAVTYLIVGGFIWGTAGLVLRVATRVDRMLLLWPLAGVVPAVIVAAWRVRGRVPSRRAARALLDSQGRCGGLLMAEGEAEMGGWEPAIPTVRAPRVRWRGRRSLALLAASAAFVAISFLLPQRYVRAGVPGRLNIDRDLARITEKVQALEDLEIMSPAQAEAIRRKLTQIRADASGSDPVTTWEALDHLEASAAKAAAEAGESALSRTEKLTRAEALAGALDCGRPGLDESRRAEAMKELAKMASDAAKDADLSDELSEPLGQACKDCTLSQQQLKELAQAVGQCKGGQLADLQRLCDAGLIDAEVLAQCRQLGQGCDPGELAELIGRMEDGQPLGELVELACRAGSKPGTGGIDRGRGDAAMTWTDATEPEAAKFKEVVLPPGAVASLKDSQLVGTSLGDPSSTGAGGVSASGVLSGSAGGGSAHTAVILPQHRPTVQRYFKREQE